MGESLTCDLCGKPATVHLTKIVNNKIQKVDLCEECAQKKGVTSPEGYSLADLLSKGVPGLSDPEPEPDPVQIECDRCGLTPRDLKRTGRLGCPDCYTHLGRLIEPMLKTLHKDSRHTGKVPFRLMQRITLRRQLTELEEALRSAIRDERYKDAAQYRDQIDQLKAALHTENATPS